MMKITFLTMAGIAALSVAAPVAAQSWHDGRSQSVELRMQIDGGVHSGAISRGDMPALRDGLRQLVALERQFSRGGISRREGAILDQRSSELRRQIDLAQRGGYRHDGDSRIAWEARYDRDHRAAWEARYMSERSAQYDRGFNHDPSLAASERFDGLNRGDRFAGDVRIGQRFSSRMSALPAQYRSDYRDTDQVYYGYDDQRIYRIDRTSGLILAMFDLAN